MRAIFFVFSLCVLVFAAPVIKGDVKLVKSRHFKPPPPLSAHQLRWRHPCVVVSDPDGHGHVKVATVSHQHCQGVKTKPANDYAPFEENPGMGGASISVSSPRTVHVSNLKDPTREPKIVGADKLQNLIKDINKNCSPDHQLTGDCSPEHGSPVHGSPDHGRLESSTDSGWQTVTRKGRRKGK